MSFITSMGGSKIGHFYSFAYWAAKLRNPEQWVSEVDNKQFDLRAYIPLMERRIKNTFDWTLDVVTTNDVLRIEELWLFCPKTPTAPQGSTGVLRFRQEDKGTAFHFNVSKMSQNGRVDCKIIGQVINRATTECIFHVWDGQTYQFYPHRRTTVNNFQAWREGIADLGAMSHEIIGLRL
jgi:hypothetical protein